ncbi:MAG TPA: hypothetical protein VK400_08320 [Pyrinomonadaceae bacterium]|nr:hypothetical protein [Pyrinomonadaceae bacterium]
MSFETIVDFALDALPGAETGLHTEACPQCELKVARVASFIEIMRQDATEEVPQSAFTAVLRAFEERRTKPENTQTATQKLRAVLRFDSAQMMAMNFGFRSAVASDSRQLLFAVGNGTLDLRITRAAAADSWTISGQMLGEIFAGKVELQGEINPAAEFDSQSHFTLPSVPGGNYRLRLYSESCEVEIPELVIA